jgi:DNA-binding ferritin-like protein
MESFGILYMLNSASVGRIRDDLGGFRQSGAPQAGGVGGYALVIALLNERLQDCIALQWKCSQARSVFVAPDSNGLRELSEEVHGAVLAYADLIAERVEELGGVVDATICGVEVLATTLDAFVDDRGALAPSRLMVDVLSEFGRSTRRSVVAMNMLGDTVSVDLMLEVACRIDQWKSLLAAHQSSGSEGVA